MTSTTREVVPVRQVDETPLGSGRPGPLTRRVMEAFRAYAPAHCGQARPHCRRQPVRPNQRLSSSRGTRTIGRPPVGAEGRVRGAEDVADDRAHLLEVEGLAGAHRRVAGQRRRQAVPRSGHRPVRRLALLQVAQDPLEGGPGVPRAQDRGDGPQARRPAPERLHVVAQLPQRLDVRVEDGEEVRGQVHHERREEALRLDGVAARALQQPLESHALVGRVLVHEQQLLAVARHDVDEPVLAQHHAARGPRAAAPPTPPRPTLRLPDAPRAAGFPHRRPRAPGTSPRRPRLAARPRAPGVAAASLAAARARLPTGPLGPPARPPRRPCARRRTSPPSSPGAR